MPPYPNLCAPSYLSQSPLAANAETINFYPEQMEVAGATEWTLYPTPGCVAFAESVESPTRGLFAHKTQAWAVQGQTLYEIRDVGTLTSRGTVAIDANPARMVTNGDGGQQLLISSGTNGYLLDLDTNVLTTVLTGTAYQVDMIDGYFLALDQATSTLALSDLLDGSTWDPLQFTQRSTAPDPWRALKVVGTRIWLLGQYTSEVWYNSGAFPFPLVPFPGALVEQGIAAPFSAAAGEGLLIWLAQNANGARTVQMATGLAPQKVSTHAIDYALSQYQTVADAEGWIYQEQGHAFYILTLPTANVTWVYDITESQASGVPLWHRRGTWNVMRSDYDAWRPRFHASQFDRHLVGDRASGALGAMSITAGLELGGGPIRRVRRPPVLQKDQQMLTLSSIQLVLEPGLGTTSGQGANPTVLMRTSQNAGKTWSAYRARSVGKTGDYGLRVRWLRNGQGRNRQDEWVMTDPVPYRIVGGVMDVQVGD